MASTGDQMASGLGGRGRLRASHADREQVIDTLKGAFVRGLLDKDEFDLRVGQTFASRTYAQLAVVTADLPAGLADVKPPQTAGVHAEPRIPRAGRVLAVASTICAAMWLVAYLLPVGGADHDSSAGTPLAVAVTFFYVLVLLMVGTPVLADWLNRRW